MALWSAPRTAKIEIYNQNNLFIPRWCGRYVSRASKRQHHVPTRRDHPEPADIKNVHHLVVAVCWCGVKFLTFGEENGCPKVFRFVSSSYEFISSNIFRQKREILGIKVIQLNENQLSLFLSGVRLFTIINEWIKIDFRTCDKKVAFFRWNWQTIQ